MESAVTVIHCLAVFLLVHAIKWQRAREEEWVHFAIVATVASVGLFGLIERVAA